MYWMCPVVDVNHLNKFGENWPITVRAMFQIVTKRSNNAKASGKVMLDAHQKLANTKI